MRLCRFIAAIALSLALAFPVCAADFGYGDAYTLPPSVSESLPEDFPSDVEIDTDTFGFDYILTELKKTVLDALSPAVSSFGTLMGLLLLSSAARLICPDKGDAISLVSCAAAGIFLLGSEADTASLVGGFATVTSTFVTSLSPLVTALHYATANTLTASVSGTGFLLFSAALEAISTYLFIPIYKASLGFAVINSASSGTTARVFDIIKRLFVLAISALALVFITVLSYQTSLAAAADTAAARGVKFVLSSSVPIVGGALGDAVGTTAAGVSVIKSASGALGVAVMILLSAPVLVRLILSSAVYSVLSFAASFLGCSREDALYTEMRGAVGFALATVTMITVVFIIAVAIFIKTSPAVSV